MFFTEADAKKDGCGIGYTHEQTPSPKHPFNVITERCSLVRFM
jgi:hypothetical protein